MFRSSMEGVFDQPVYLGGGAVDAVYVQFKPLERLMFGQSKAW